MGKISCVYKVMPEDAETDLEQIKEDIKELIDVEDIGEEKRCIWIKSCKGFYNHNR